MWRGKGKILGDNMKNVKTSFPPAYDKAYQSSIFKIY
jgi:hypothetical protein